MRNSAASQNGSALVYIFIGVILFAALALSFSRGMNQSSSGVSAKTAKVGASEIVEYAKTIERAVNKMVLNGISESDLDFSNMVTTLTASGGALYTGNAGCATASCKVFDPSGGKIKPLELSPDYLIDNGLLGAGDPMAGAIIPNVVVVDTLGSADPELVISFYGLSEPVCVAINDMFKVDNPGNRPPSENATAAGDMFTGAYTSATTIGDGTPDLAGRTDFCYKQSGSSPAIHVYDHVLLTR